MIGRRFLYSVNGISKRFTTGYICAGLLVLSMSCNAQTSTVHTASDISLLLQKLNRSASILYMAAHPDDENNRLLSYWGKGLQLRTGYLALNRGEGGQNLIGDEQGDALGLIRTNELLGARSVDGASQFFTRAYDFGYSKNPQETFSIWNRDSVLADAVWVIRSFRPDVIVDRFPTTGEGGHGHHTASAILSVEAMEAAADPTRFPEQLSRVRVWKVRRLFWNTFNFGGMNTQAPDQFKIEVGGYNPQLGKSYGELAAESRSFHKSQGFGSAASRGNEYEYFKLIKGDGVTHSLFEGIDTSWSRIPGAAQTAKWALKALHEFNPQLPEKIVPDLLEAYKAADLIKDPFWVNEKKQELVVLIQACSGIWISANSTQPEWSERSTMQIGLNLIIRTSVPVKLEGISLNGKNVSGPRTLACNQLLSTEVNFTADPTMLTQPYWLKNRHTTGGYNPAGQEQYRGMAVNPAPVQALFMLSFSGTYVPIPVPVLFHTVDPAQGESYQPLRILPPVSIEPRDQLLVFSSAGKKTVRVVLTSYENKLQGTLSIHVPKGYQVSNPDLKYAFKFKGEKAEFSFEILLADKSVPKLADSISFSSDAEGLRSASTVNTLIYGHIPHMTWLSPAVIKVINPDLKIPGGSIGYISGAGDQIPAVLEQLGYKVSILTDVQLANEDLSRFDAIITGIRAYNTRPSLKNLQPKLINYVHEGGCLIEQYNKPGGLVTEDLGPYPFQVSSKRITNENAPIQINEPDSRLLNIPNKITGADFNDWIQERAVYIPVNADLHYHSPIRMNDPAETPLENTLLYTSYGKGAYIYTGLVFFREIPAGVPGAIRLFVNMLSAAKKL